MNAICCHFVSLFGRPSLLLQRIASSLVFLVESLFFHFKRRTLRRSGRYELRIDTNGDITRQASAAADEITTKRIPHFPPQSSLPDSFILLSPPVSFSSNSLHSQLVNVSNCPSTRPSTRPTVLLLLRSTTTEYDHDHDHDDTIIISSSLLCCRWPMKSHQTKPLSSSSFERTHYRV